MQGVGQLTPCIEDAMSWTEVDERKKKERQGVSDAMVAERHRGFDLSAQDNHMKYERPSFIVVGEGSKSANDNYRENYEKMDWSK